MIAECVVRTCTSKYVIFTYSVLFIGGILGIISSIGSIASACYARKKYSRKTPINICSALSLTVGLCSLFAAIYGPFLVIYELHKVVDIHYTENGTDTSELLLVNKTVNAPKEDEFSALEKDLIMLLICFGANIIVSLIIRSFFNVGSKWMGVRRKRRVYIYFLNLYLFYSICIFLFFRSLALEVSFHLF